MHSYLFTPGLAQLVHEGRKTQTRRLRAPGMQLDQLCYVRESFALEARWNTGSPADAMRRCRALIGQLPRARFQGEYRHQPVPRQFKGEPSAWGRWRPGIHLPSELSRTYFVPLEFRTEPLQAISEEDAIAEGFASVAEFQAAWVRIHGRDTWDRNITIHVTRFKPIPRR